MSDVFTGEVVVTSQRKGPPANSFIKRRIEVDFTLVQGSFSGGGTTSTVTGLRCGAYIDKVGSPGIPTLQLVIFGMPLSLMNKLSTLGHPYSSVPFNTITVRAGDDNIGLPVVFVGNIQQAWVDLNRAPDAAFNVIANPLAQAANAPTQPVSFTGAADVVTLMSGFADKMDMTFENNGVVAGSFNLSTPYFAGSLLQQAQACARAAGINWIADDGVLAIWPRGGYRSSVKTLVLSPETGLLGYPTYTLQGVIAKTVFNPSLQFGAQFKIESSITPANGLWTVFRVTHDLESETPDGAWFTDVEATNFLRPAS